MSVDDSDHGVDVGNDSNICWDDHGDHSDFGNYFYNTVDVGDDSDVGRGDHDNYFVIVIVSKSVDVGGKIQPALQGEPQLHGCLIVRHVRGDLSTRDEYDGEENNDTIANFSLKTQTNGELTRVEHI